LWTFTDEVSQARQAYLLAGLSFSEVIENLAQAEVLSFCWEWFNDARLKGCKRAVYRIRVSVEAYDKFFNSPVGYRVQYAVNPSGGQKSNHELIDHLEPNLCKHALTHGELSADAIKWSLRAPQSKIWIEEKEVEVQLGSHKPAIKCQPWQENSEHGVGLLAPVGNLLEIKGAWLDRNDVAQIDPRKLTRSDDIHLTGFS
jgi:hypothetical protein